MNNPNDFGFKISLPGFDVQTATPEQCSVHSSYPPLKSKTNQDPPHFAELDVRFTATLPQNVTTTAYAINHGYNYVPATIPSMSFVDDFGGTYAGIGFIGVGATLVIKAYATSTQFIVSIYDNNSWTGTHAQLQVSYYIFAENGA